MSQHVVFVDCDGTLTNSSNTISSNVKQAIKTLKDNGHAIYLCTGRSDKEISDDILACNFDGIIGASGGFLKKNGDFIFKHKFDPLVLKGVLELLDKNDIYYQLECFDGVYCSDFVVDYLRQEFAPYFNEEILEKWVSMYQPLQKCDFDNVGKIAYMHSQLSNQQLQELLPSQLRVYEDTFSHDPSKGEIGLSHVNKATAIDYVLSHYYLDDVISYGIGDGGNDIEMIEQCHIGIAMGNAKESVKEIADYITDTNDNDGVVMALKHYALI